MRDTTFFIVSIALLFANLVGAVSDANFLSSTALANHSIDDTSPERRSLAALDPRFLQCNLYPPAICKLKGSPGPTCCSGACVNTTLNHDNCGKCGRVCSDSDLCCTGKCAKIISDESNCGKCGVTCTPTQYCCGGQCINYLVDSNNCGKCGKINCVVKAIARRCFPTVTIAGSAARFAGPTRSAAMASALRCLPTSITAGHVEMFAGKTRLVVKGVASL
ncbi:Stigma-specific STIG1-like protein 3 [Carex littledalei]|uniref:Stigma-specific STIG1-like protein 3 n=1 Tax=Carex littledalei TaxID=544730 RepID=A0A833VG83_9POAL|nr:Stigma-specific STIG1-like protein 3 [Carex littledalei]